MARQSSSDLAADDDAFVARQPIFNRKRQVVGYELLARMSTDNVYAHTDGNHATADALSTSLNLLGLDVLTGGARVYVNFTRELLLDDFAALLSPQAMVIELLEDIEPDEAVLDACRRLKREGYTLVLDDFVQHAANHALVAMADMIKVDFMATPAGERARLAELHVGCRSLLAEKVETPADFEEGCRLGYEYFQGYFFCKPQVFKARRIDETQTSRLRLLHAASQPNVDFDQLEMIIKQDASLSVKLLRYLNTSVRATRTEITSIKQALTLLGQRPLRRWAAMAALASIGQDKPMELLRTCVVRARFCELLAEHALERRHSFTMYLVGLLSAIDAVLDRPLCEILEQLAVPDPVRQTLLEPAGRLSDLYHVALAYERGEWPRVEATCSDLALAHDLVVRSYRDALTWSSHLAVAA